MIRGNWYKAQVVNSDIWVEGNLFQNYIGTKDSIFVKNYIHDPISGINFPVKEETVCQYINKIDINKNYIYENDVVETTNGFQLQVVWSHEFDRFMYKNLNKGYDFMIGKICVLSAFTNKDELKVIGNIFGNTDFRKKDLVVM